MCLIIKKPHGKVIPAKHLLYSSDHNADGWGIMWASNGRVHVERGMETGVKALNAALATAKNRRVYTHQRFGTHGSKTLDNCHPFCVLDKDRDGIDLYLMHNGVLSAVPEFDLTKSDTWHYMQALRGAILADRSLLTNAAFWKAIAVDIGRSNKFVFLFGDGREVILNRDSGTDIDGLWYSNTYSIKDMYESYQQPYGGHWETVPTGGKIWRYNKPANATNDLLSDADDLKEYEKWLMGSGKDDWKGVSTKSDGKGSLIVTKNEVTTAPIPTSTAVVPAKLPAVIASVIKGHGTGDATKLFTDDTEGDFNPALSAVLKGNYVSAAQALAELTDDDLSIIAQADPALAVQLLSECRDTIWS